jgi:carbon storage regulator CsrA
MLILSRNKMQRIMIGDDIVVTVIAFKNERGEPGVQLGIDAPDDVAVDREEIRIQKQCVHEWVDARNEVVQSGVMCLKCKTVKAG